MYAVVVNAPPPGISSRLSRAKVLVTVVNRLQAVAMMRVAVSVWEDGPN